MRNKILTAMTLLVVVGVGGAGYIYMNRMAEKYSGGDTPTRKESSADAVISAQEDYSSWAKPVTDGDGVLHIPDSQAVSGSTASVVSCRNFSISIPERWVGNVTIKTIERMEDLVEEETEDGAVVGLPETAVTYVMQFFEKATYDKYRTQDYIYSEGSELKGKITEISYVPQEADLSNYQNNPRQAYIATVTGKDNKKYNVYVLQLSGVSGSADPEDGGALAYLADADYVNCFAKSLTAHNGTKTFPNTYVEACALAYQGDAGSAEIPELYTSQRGGSAEAYPVSTIAPNLPQYQSASEVYPYTAFSSPWTYNDSGSAYQYTAAASGEAAPESQSVVLGPSDVITDDQVNQGVSSDNQYSPNDNSTGYIQGDYSDNTWSDTNGTDTNIWGDDTAQTQEGYVEVYDNGDVTVWGE